MMIRILHTFRGKQCSFEQDAPNVVIGRPKDAVHIDLDLTPDLLVSRPHARIWFEGEQYWIEDLGSTGGTKVAGEDIRWKGKRRLHPGDTIQVGETTLNVKIPNVKPEPGPALSPRVPIAGSSPDITYTVDATIPGAALPANATNEAAGRLSLLYELPLQLAAATSLDTLLQKILERLADIIPGATRGALLLKEPGTGNLLLKAHVPPGEPAVSMTLARRAMEQKLSFIWNRSEENASLSMTVQNISTGMFAPLLWKGESLGVVCIDNANASCGFGDEDLRLLLAVAQQAAMAVATHQLHDDLRRNAAVLSRLLTNFSPKIRETLLNKAHQGRLRPGGERSEVSLLFADIRGFTRLSAEMDADEVVDLLNNYFPTLIDPIFKNDGTIDNIAGDGILAVFGSPEPDVQQHEKAVQAALQMQWGLQELNRARAERGDVVCGVGIGVHCGEVVHGFVGTADRMEFTVIGDAVNRASRYCAGAAAGEVLISPELYQRVWKIVQAQETTIPTKHEGDFRAYRVRGLR